jgi:hypothetical protein
MFVCSFVMHSVPIIATGTKLSMVLLQVQKKVDRGLARPRRVREGGWEKFQSASTNCNFLVIMIANVTKLMALLYV